MDYVKSPLVVVVARDRDFPVDVSGCSGTWISSVAQERDPPVAVDNPFERHAPRAARVHCAPSLPHRSEAKSYNPAGSRICGGNTTGTWPESAKYIFPRPPSVSPEGRFRVFRGRNSLWERTPSLRPVNTERAEARRHGERNWRGFELGLRIDSSSIPSTRGGSRSRATEQSIPTPSDPGARSTRAALGAWRPNGLCTAQWGGSRSRAPA